MKLLTDVIAIAIQAGEAIMEIYTAQTSTATLKADQSPLTEADLASHRVIISGLARLTPDWPILSEESAQIDVTHRSEWKKYWLVDPLDGTKEFIKRNGEFTVNIALIENRIPVMGVVYAPVLDVCYYAEKGSGAFVKHGIERPQRINAKPHSVGESIKVVASRSHNDARTEALLKKLGKCESINMGSSLKLCLVAEGLAHFYPRLGPTMEWDTAAAHAIVSEAGGTVCNSAAEELTYNKADLHNSEFFVYSKMDNSYNSVMKALQ